MRIWNKRIWPFLLCMCMLVSFLPVSTQAALVDGSDYLVQQLSLGESLTFRIKGNANYLYAGNAVATVAYADQVDTYRLEDLTVCEDGLYEV